MYVFENFHVHVTQKPRGATNGPIDLVVRQSAAQSPNASKEGHVSGAAACCVGSMTTKHDNSFPGRGILIGLFE